MPDAPGLPLKVFLTGASSGIGEALARHYAGRGARLGLVARRSAELERLGRSLGATETATYTADVRDDRALAQAGADYITRFGAPDVVIANAGISQGTLTGPPEDLPTFRAILDTNVLGMVNTFAPFVDRMSEARRGALVGIASVAGFRGLPGAGAYSASKAAAIRYLESLRVELRDSGVAVVTICPGYIATPMTVGNPYAMPFLMPVDQCAPLIAQAIARRRRFYVLPWQMAWVGRLLRALPRPVYDRVFAHAPRKPRNVR